MNKLINHWKNPKNIAATLISDEIYRLKIPSSRNIIKCKQVHGNRVIEINNSNSKIKPVCDGLVTKQSGVTLVVQTADCIPIFFVEDERNIIGVIHAGWRGTLATIAVKALKLIHDLGGNPKKIRVHLGPHIHKCCYEISNDLANKFTNIFGNETVNYIDNKNYLDLGLVTEIQLLQNNIKKENITNSQECTYCDNSLFSYRRSKINNTKCGSMYSYIQNIQD